MHMLRDNNNIELKTLVYQKPKNVISCLNGKTD